MSSAFALPFDNSYARLPDHFFARIAPTPVASPSLIQLNTALAEQLGLDPALLASPEGIEVLAGNRIAQGSEPIALAYAGHQFGHFVPQLGDGRANLLGEVVARSGLRYDLQLKGSGPTPFSRRGDGRAALGPVLREYLVSEAMFALGVPTTRALAAVLTGQPVYRESILPGAILTRVASSHLRVGTFQYFAARGDTAALRTLAEYAISRHYPDLAQSDRPISALLHAVIARHASLVAQWMLLGFLHGVMNTDNTSISGETIDYGPCAFLEAYEPAKVYSSIDQQGRYAYRNQPFAASWNLSRLAETLLPLLQQELGTEQAALDTANAAIATFEPLYDAARLEGLRRKLGLTGTEPGDAALAEDLLTRMATNRADFTLTFARLTDAAASPSADATVRTLFADPTAYDTWAPLWRTRQPDPTAMRQANPLVIPRNHLVQEAITAAEAHDLTPFQALLSAVTNPQTPTPRYTTPATPHEEIPHTFCGT